MKIVTEEEEPAVSSIAADKEGTDFGAALEGYTEAPEAQTVILTNSGTADAEIIYYVNDKDEAQYFDVSLSDSIIARDGGTVSFTIRPKTGLPAGVYEEYFTVQDKVSGTEIPIRAGFTVEAASHSLNSLTGFSGFRQCERRIRGDRSAAVHGYKQRQYGGNTCATVRNQFCGKQRRRAGSDSSAG